MKASTISMRDDLMNKNKNKNILKHFQPDSGFLLDTRNGAARTLLFWANWSRLIDGPKYMFMCLMIFTYQMDQGQLVRLFNWTSLLFALIYD